MVIDAHLHLWDVGRLRYEWLRRPDVGEGLALLEQRDVPFDVIAVLPRHLSHVPVLSERYPALRMVLDHLTHPPLGGASTRERQALISAAARNPRVFAKVSGLYPPGSSRGRLRPEKLLCRGDHPDLFFPPVWSAVP